jgi:hypothetical protein
MIDGKIKSVYYLEAEQLIEFLGLELGVEELVHIMECDEGCSYGVGCGCCSYREYCPEETAERARRARELELKTEKRQAENDAAWQAQREKGRQELEDKGLLP